jgi:hypothetical protein
VRKRVRPSVDITSLSSAQVAVLSEAAAILQVSVSDLADLPKTLNNRSQRLESDNRSHAISEAIAPQQQLSIMEAIPSQSRSRAQATGPKSKEQSKFRPAILHDPAPNDICDPQPFSLGLIPKQIVDCFAGFKYPTSRLALPAESQGKYFCHPQKKKRSYIDHRLGDTTNFDTGVTMTESSLLPDNSKRQLFSSSLSYTLLPLETSTGMDILDDGFSHDSVLSGSHCRCLQTNILTVSIELRL